MIKIVLDIKQIEYDVFMRKLVNRSKEHPEEFGGVRIPDMTIYFLNMMAPNQKNEKISSIINNNKPIMISQLEGILEGVFGRISLCDASVEYNRFRTPPAMYTMVIDRLDRDRLFDNILPAFHSDAEAGAMFSKEYSGPYDLEGIKSYLGGLDEEALQRIVADGMNRNSQMLMQNLSKGFADAGIANTPDSICVTVE